MKHSKFQYIVTLKLKAVIHLQIRKDNTANEAKMQETLPIKKLQLVLTLFLQTLVHVKLNLRNF